MSWYDEAVAANPGWRGRYKVFLGVLYLVIGLVWPGPFRLFWLALAALNLALIEAQRRRYLRETGRGEGGG